MNGDYIQPNYPTVEHEELEGVEGYVIRFDGEDNWQWISKKDAAQLQRELNEKGPGSRKSLFKFSIG